VRTVSGRVQAGSPAKTKNYGQASRPISTGQLHALLRFHTRPIDVVVSDGPLGTLRSGDP